MRRGDLITGIDRSYVRSIYEVVDDYMLVIKARLVAYDGHVLYHEDHIQSLKDPYNYRKATVQEIIQAISNNTPEIDDELTTMAGPSKKEVDMIKKWDEVKKNPHPQDMCSCTEPHGKKEVIISAAMKFWICTACKKECQPPLPKTSYNDLDRERI